MSLLRLLAVLLPALVASGCVVAIDPHWVTARANPATPQLIAGTWKARAIYHTHGGLLAPETLAEALHVPGSEADEAKIAYSNEQGLAVTFMRAGEQIFEPMVFTASEHGLHVDADGSIELPGRETLPGSEFSSRTNAVRLFIDRHGELYCVEGGGGMGFIGPWPVAGYAELVSRFARAR